MKTLSFFRATLVMITASSITFFAGCQQNTPAAQTAMTQMTNSTSMTAPSTAIASAGSYDPCNLITAADVQTDFPGGAITVKTHDMTPSMVGQKICLYSASATDAKFVQIAVTSNGSIPADVVTNGESAAKLYNDTKKLFPNVQQISGIGSDAYFTGTGLGGGLHVLSNDQQAEFDISIGLGFGNTDKKTHLDMETALAQKVLSRLETLTK